MEKSGNFTMIGNVLLDALCKLRCSGGQMNVLMSIIRWTLGYQMDCRELSQTFLAKHTGRSKNKIGIDVADLIKRRIVIEVRPPTHSKSRILKINKNIHDWIGLPLSGTSIKDVTSEMLTDSVSDDITGIVSGKTSDTGYDNQLNKNIKIKNNRDLYGIDKMAQEVTRASGHSSSTGYSNPYFAIDNIQMEKYILQYDSTEGILTSEFEKMRVWLTGNPEKAKRVKKKIEGFIDRWLATNAELIKAVNRPPSDIIDPSKPSYLPFLY